ncbi:MAG TPA: class I SAM-dependent methyltransferase [Terriglobia bacterium]|nr:class I SAM-dependent methyltransferase [Terriglobia bacterium]
MRLLDLLSLLPRHPVEFADRVSGGVSNRLGARFDEQPKCSLVKWPAALSQLGEALQADLTAILAEAALERIAKQVRTDLELLPADAPFSMIYNGSPLLAQLCYAMVRAARPKVVVETGVCYGVTSSYILSALEENQSGMLYSIDLPPLAQEANRYHGCLVPQHLRKRWRLSCGPSKRLLPKIAREVGPVDLFLHDSLHTYRNMRREFAVMTRNLRCPGIIVSDDVNWNTAFLECVASKSPAYWATIGENPKESALGVAVFNRAGSMG